MEIGVHLPTTQGPGVAREALMAFAQEAERRSIASLWVSDHVVIPRVTRDYPGGARFPHPPDTPYLEPVVVLGAVAMCTTRARLGASVFILGHRHPVVMAKMLAGTSGSTMVSPGPMMAVGALWKALIGAASFSVPFSM